MPVPGGSVPGPDGPHRAAALPLYAPPQRRPAQPEPDPGRERRPPQQLYVPPRRRQGGASYGFNRASSPGFSTCSEIVTSWRVAATPSPRHSPGPHSPLLGRPPAGPRRRLSQQAAEAAGGWWPGADSAGPPLQAGRQAGSAAAAGAAQKGSGRRRRRSGRRSRSQSEDRPPDGREGAGQPPVTPPPAPWRRLQHDSWDGRQPCRSPSPCGPARPRFQQPYQPPPLRDPEPASPARERGRRRRGQARQPRGQTPPPPAAGPTAARPARAGQPQPERHHTGPQSPGRRQGSHGPAAGLHDSGQCQAVTQHQHAGGRAGPQPSGGEGGSGARRASPSISPGRSRATGRPEPPDGADERAKSASLGRPGRRSSRRSRRRRGAPAGSQERPSDSATPAAGRRSVSPTSLIASLQLETAPLPEPACPQSPTDIIASLRASQPARPTLPRLQVGPQPERQPQMEPQTGPVFPQSPTDMLRQLALQPEPALPRTDSHGQLINTTDDEKATLGVGRGRGGGRRGHAAVQASGIGGVWSTPGWPQSDEDKAQLWRSDGERGGGRPGCEPVLAPARASGPPAAQDTGEKSTPSDSAGAVRPPVPGPEISAPAGSPSASRVEQCIGTKAQSSPSQNTGSIEAKGKEGTSSSEQVDLAVGSETTDKVVLQGSGAITSVGDAPATPLPAEEQTDTSGSALPVEKQAHPAGPLAPAGDVGDARGTPSPAERARRRSSASSGCGGLFSGGSDEPFDWADEVEEWERRFNDEGDVTDRALQEPRRTSQQPVAGRSSPHRADGGLDDVVTDPSMPAHVIEVYNFPSSFTTGDFNVVFQDFVVRGFDLRRVDETHALAIFSNAACASEALRLRHPMVLCRPLSQATAPSRRAAARPADVRPPYRARPETCALHAGRMVASALGVREGGAGRQRRDRDRRKLREAKERKVQATKQKEDAWHGRF